MAKMMSEPQQFLIHPSEDGTTRNDVMLEATVRLFRTVKSGHRNAA